jgi:hypothetical protein
MANQGMTWPQAIAELIDNAFDADADRVELKFSGSPKRHWEVKDDGRGCPDLSKMLPLGSHFDQGSVSQPVGMWGIGLKDAWAFSGPKIEVESTSKGRRGRIAIDIGDVSPDWECADPVYEDADKKSRGTVVRLYLRAKRGFPRSDTWERIRWLFTPALANVRQIVVSESSGRKTVLKPVAMPPFVDSVEASFEVQGKSVSIAIGIVKDGHPMKNGPFWVVYGHRIVKNSPIGAGKYSTLRMGGKIVLGKGWVLTKNKDDLSDFSEELADAVFERIEPLLMKHEQLSEDVESAALKAELEGMLNQSIKDAKKEKRASPENETGAVVPKQTGRQRRNFKNAQDGGSKRKRTGFHIDWMDDDGGMLGEYDDLANVIRLNVRHPFVADAKLDGNRPALYAVAVSIMAHTLCNADTKGHRLLFELGSFPDTLAKLMRTMKGKLESSTNAA